MGTDSMKKIYEAILQHGNQPTNINMKALVMASLDAYTRPLDKVSVTQSASLSATGLIWTRYCLVIIPVNYSLAICNFALGVANGIQTVRAYRFQNQKAIA